MADRIRVLVLRFFSKFDTVPVGKLAEILGVSDKTVQRLREGKTDPREPTLRKMLDLIEKIDAEVLATDSERLLRAEQLRAGHERQQRALALSVYEDKLEKNYPRWFQRVRSNMHEEKYREAVEAITDHLEDPSTWNHVDEEAKPYILHALGVAYYRSGSNIEAQEASEAALRELSKAGRNSASPELHAWTLVNKGLSFMRLLDTKQAFALFEEAILVAPDTVGGYYNALCCASILEAEDLVGLWTGRFIEASPRFSLIDINDVLQRVEADKDLVFLRNLPIMDDLRSGLRRARDLATN